MDTGIKTAIKQICAEKGLSEESVYETINAALAAAFRKDFGDKTQNVEAEFNPDTGQTIVYDVKEVVEDLTPEEVEYMEKLKAEREKIKEMLESGEITPDELKKQRIEEEKKREQAEEAGEEEDEIRKFNPRTEIEEKEAKKIKKSYKIGAFVKTKLEIPGEFGRMAAQTAKQVIVQKLREAERNVLYQEYKEREGEIIIGMVQKFEGRNIVIDLNNKATAILPPNEQIRTERLKIGDRTKVYLKSVAITTKGPELIVTRAHPLIVEKLFEQEIPEIANKTIEIKGLAREAGSRTKIAVYTEDDSIDPIGSCIGQKGARIQTIINELSGEKIDIIEYNEDPIKYIGNSLLPAKITNIEINEENKTATVIVPEDQLSLTIGRAGQNVRLASKLTDWAISIKEEQSGKEITAEAPTEEVVEEAPVVEEVKPVKKAEKKTKEKITKKKKAAKDEEKVEVEKKEKKTKKKAKKEVVEEE
jgi:transcription termination/antitermination protein NusA